MALMMGVPPFIVNIVGYALIAGGPALWGIFGNGKSTDDLAPIYQTLITPAGVAFSIWGIIYTWEFVFTVAQALPPFRNSEMVAAISPWWIPCSLFTILWTIAFSLEAFILSHVGMLGIWVCLLGITLQLDNLKGISTVEYWLIRAPFSLHGGWVTVAHFLNLNVIADSLQAPAPELVANAIASLCIVFALNVIYALLLPRPDPILCVAAAWASWWIHVGLQTPERFLDKINNPVTLDLNTLAGFSLAASYLSVIFLILAAVATPLRLRSWRSADAEAAKGTVEMGEEPLQASLGA